ncbi:MAG TPA: SDR family oxidoreductase [Phycisphaerales bacterium]|nr:SDR family oxidoreductase [Phycisphaerales bacterium]
MSSSSGPHQPIALITGASSGIGLAAAEHFARRGWRTILVARREQELSRLASELSSSAPSFPIVLDVTDDDRLDAAVRDVLDRFGAPDALINNAGSNDYMPFLDLSLATHRDIFRVNYHAPARLIYLLLPAMLQRRKGHVINITSMSAKIGPWGHSSYAAAKAALTSLTQTLAAEHEGSGVYFSYLHPGIVRTPYFESPANRPLWDKQKRRAIEPDAVARAIVGLIDRPRLEVCVPAHFRLIDFLTALSPTIAHRIVARSSRVDLPPSSTPPLP